MVNIWARTPIVNSPTGKAEGMYVEIAKEALTYFSVYPPFTTTTTIFSV